MQNPKIKIWLIPQNAAKLISSVTEWKELANRAEAEKRLLFKHTDGLSFSWTVLLYADVLRDDAGFST
jgi:hypothetical protein